MKPRRDKTAGESSGEGDFIFLVGNRGCGKSTVGRLLAKKLGRPFVDLDAFLVRRSQRSIADIVSRDGWPEFRRHETMALEAAVNEYPLDTVVATGGGIVLSAHNREFMQRSGHVIWLDIPLECACRRLAANPDAANRPSLTGIPFLEELRQVFTDRRPLYKLASRHVVNADADCEVVCREIIKKLGQSVESQFLA